MKHSPAAWRFYRGAVGRIMGWSLGDIMAMRWDELLKEFDLAVQLKGIG